MYNSITGKVFFVLLSIAVLIILLNLLIALLSDSYEEIKEREEMEFTMQRANLICHLEVCLHRHLTALTVLAIATLATKCHHQMSRPPKSFRLLTSP
jgi:hypothetical protein